MTKPKPPHLHKPPGRKPKHSPQARPVRAMLEPEDFDELRHRWGWDGKHGVGDAIKRAIHRVKARTPPGMP